VELYPALLKYFECRRKFNLINGVSDPVLIVTIHLLKTILDVELSVQLQAKAINLVKATAQVMQRVTV